MTATSFSASAWRSGTGSDPILKERLFGLTGNEGNHGEDVKEVYFYLDSTPTHSYMKMLYRYPQAAFPYADLVAENRGRGFDEPEYELIDTGVFDEDRFFDVFVEYAKAAPDDLVINVEIVNRGPESAACTVLPILWFRNTWSWGYPDGPMGYTHGKPALMRGDDVGNARAVAATHPSLGDYWLYADGSPELLFTENETNRERLFGLPNATPYVKDAFHRLIIDGEETAVSPDQGGSKAAAHYALLLAPGERAELRLRLADRSPLSAICRLYGGALATSGRGRSFLRSGSIRGADRRRTQDPAPCAGRHALVQATVLL